MNRVKDPFGDLFDKKGSQPMKKSALPDTPSRTKAASELEHKTIAAPRPHQIKDEALYQSMQGLDDLSAAPKPAAAAKPPPAPLSGFDVFGNFDDVALPEARPPTPPQVEEPGITTFSSGTSTPQSPPKAAGDAAWDTLRQLATGLVDLGQEAREARLAAMDEDTRARMLVVMQENWEEYGFARHTMALCMVFGVQPTAAFELLCAQENSLIERSAPMSRASSSSSASSFQPRAEPAQPALPRSRLGAAATPPPASLNLLDDSIDSIPDGILPPGFSPPPPLTPSPASARPPAKAATPSERALPPPRPNSSARNGGAAPARVDFVATSRSLPSSSAPDLLSLSSPRETSSLPAPKSSANLEADGRAPAPLLVSLDTPPRTASGGVASGSGSLPADAPAVVDLLGDDALSGAVQPEASPATNVRFAPPEADLIGAGDLAGSSRLGSVPSAHGGVDLLGDALVTDDAPDLSAFHVPAASAHAGGDLLGDAHSHDPALDSFFAFVDSAAPSTPASALPSRKTSSHGGTAHSQAGGEASSAAGSTHARRRREEVSEEDSELAAKLTHLAVNARLEDVALAIGLGQMQGFDERVLKARPMWDGMQKDKPTAADPPLRHNLWKARVHKQIAKVLLSLVELEEKEKRIQAEAEVGRAARPAIQKEIDTWARENMGVKRLPNLLATLHKGPLWDGAKWSPVNLSDVLDDKKLKLIYRKAMLLTHTDKHADSTPEIRERAKLIFDYLVIAKDKMNQEKGGAFL